MLIENLIKDEIAFTHQKWPNYLRHGWPDVKHFWWPNANAMGGRFGAFFAPKPKTIQTS